MRSTRWRSGGKVGATDGLKISFEREDMLVLTREEGQSESMMTIEGRTIWYASLRNSSRTSACLQGCDRVDSLFLERHSFKGLVISDIAVLIL